MNSGIFSAQIVDHALPKGWAVARKDRFVVFLPDGVIGDRVTVKTIQNRKNFSFGEVLAIEELSPFRTTPPCPHFGLCGGCLFQNLQYEKQLEIKRNYLSVTLKHIGSVREADLSGLKINPSPDLYFYRNKMEFSIGTQDDNSVVGLRERTSPLCDYEGNIVPLESCMIFSPHVKGIFATFREFISSACDQETRKRLSGHLVLKEGKRTGELMIVLITANIELPDFAPLYDMLTAAVPSIKSFYWIIQNENSDPFSSGTVRTQFGRKYIEEGCGNCTFSLYPRSFFQPNTKSAEPLYARIREYANLTGKERVLGLYCGSGGMEIMISPDAKEVIGIDVSPENISVARENSAKNDCQNCTFYEGMVEKVVAQKPIGQCDLLLLDPPRGGLTPKARTLVSELNIPRIIYVSCNPATIARDLSIFTANQYAVRRVEAFDLFPHTAHIETVVLLEK